MKSIKLLFIIICLLISCTIIQTCTSQLEATDMNLSVDGKVVRLTLPIEGIAFSVTWVEEKGQGKKRLFHPLLARKGTHVYEMRDHPDWDGAVQAIRVLFFKNIPVTLKKPSLKEELELFLTPEQLLKRTINILHGKTFFGYRWNTVLLCLMVFLAILFHFYKKKNLVLSLFLGFIIAWGVMDLRTMYDHFYIMKTIDDNFSIVRSKYIKDFAKNASKIISQENWTLKVKESWHKDVIFYELAEHKYVPYESNLKDVFLILSKKDGNLVLVKKVK